jgi:hypothetical protein
LDRGPTDWIALAELELEAICLVLVDGIVVQDLDVHDPDKQVLRRYESDTRRRLLVELQVRSVHELSIASFMRLP